MITFMSVFSDSIKVLKKANMVVVVNQMYPLYFSEYKKNYVKDLIKHTKQNQQVGALYFILFYLYICTCNSFLMKLCTVDGCRCCRVTNIVVNNTLPVFFYMCC